MKLYIVEGSYSTTNALYFLKRKFISKKTLKKIVGAIKRLLYKNKSIIGVVYLILRYYAKGN